MRRRLLADISSHGYGHLSQTGPVLNELWYRRPDIRLAVRSALPREVLERRIEAPFEHLAEALDFGMVMKNAVDLDLEASAARYLAFHENWEARVAREAELLKAIAPDLLLANVPYLSLAAASRAGIPAVAMSSLNWADIFLGTLGHIPQAPAIHDQMLAAYRGAGAFLQLTPGMEMSDLPNLRAIGPVARIAGSRRDSLEHRLGIPAGERLVMVALGGIPMRLPLEQWPRLPGVRWLVPASWQAARPDALAIEAAGLGFTELLASCDAVIAKTGYGTFTEAACNRVRVLYVRRPGWPEEPPLVEWLRKNATCAEVDRERLEQGAFAEDLLALLARDAGVMVPATGAAEAAVMLSKLLPE